MKRTILALCLSCLLSTVTQALTVVEPSDGYVLMPAKDGGNECTVEGTVTFRLDPTASYSYKDVGMVFKPSKAGEIIIATIQSVDLPTGGALLVYDNNISAIADKLGKSGASTGTYRYFPDGWTTDYNQLSEAVTYQSADPDGQMAFGMHTSSWTSGKSFTVTVTSAVPADMEYKSTTVTAGSGLHRGQQSAPLATINIVTEGINSPLTLGGIKADVSALATAGVTDIALYAGTAINAGSRLATAEGGRINWAAASTLQSGNNRYTIAGNLPCDFSGTLAMPADIEADVDGSSRTATAQSAAIDVANAIYMPAEHATFVIDGSTPFYDDGGADGKISANFQGAVTFVPATAGSQIRIDFDRLAIFYNSSAVSVGNQDVFKFYNGRTADEENLIATLTDKARIVKSTAADGSLTVTLASKTGVPADGWEAFVSQFVPGDMTVDAATATAAATTAASAYDSGVQLATVCVRAVNTLNPLSVESVSLQLQGADDIEALRVYAPGEENTFSTANQAGQLTAVADGPLTINLSDATLAEGANYYAIVADFKPTASNGDVVKLTPTGVRVGGVLHAIAGYTPADVTVQNRFGHRAGTEVRQIHDVWEFYSTPDEISTGKYKLQNADCQVTFVPAEGAVAILDFSEFDVYYASGSYGTRARFDIYSGTDTDAANLLWTLDANGKKPEGKIKSTAEDGSVTIVFNANTTSSYYAGKGWKATVTPFVNHPMTVGEVTVSQSTTAPVAPGAYAQTILDVTIPTEGTLDLRRLTGVTVDLKGSAASITRVSVLYYGNEMGSKAVETTDTEVEIACDLSLAEGLNTITIAYDISGDVEADAAVDARLVKLTTDTGSIEVAEGDPEGSRVAKYQFVMSDGDHVVTVGRTIHFYDDGGSDGILSKDGLNGTVTFVPADPTKKIRATVVSYYTAATGILDFYSGHAIAEVSLGQCKQRTFPELPMVSKADDGSMFVNVACKSYSYSDYDGWDIIIEQYEPADLHVQAVTADNAAAATMVRGISDAPLSRITMQVEGDTRSVGLSHVDAVLTASEPADVKELKLWYTAKSEGFAPTRLMAAATPAADGTIAFDIAEPARAEELGNYYYWITVTLSNEAAAGNTVALAVNSVTDTNGGNMDVHNVTEQTTAVKAGFAGGNFLIGHSDEADFSTFAAAIAAMDDAIEGPVTFRVEPGTYAEDIYISEIRGSSAEKPIIFTSQSGNKNDVILTGRGYVDGGYGSAKYGIINIKNTDWVTIDNMTINGKVSGSTQYPYYVNYVEASRHNTLSNCVLTAETATSYSGLNEVYATCSDPVENGKNPDWLTITGNSFTGGYVAIYLQGSNGYIKNDHMKGLTVIGNTFTDIGSKGVYPYQVEDVEISDNIFTAGAAVTKTSYYAIDMVRCKGQVDVFNNIITNNQTVYSSGIYLRDDTHGTADRPIRVYNNAIAITASPNASSSGINITSECNYIDVVHNSVNIYGTGGHGLYISNNKDALKHAFIANNLVKVDNTTATGAAYAFNLNNTALLPGISFANNAMHSTSSLSNLAADLESWTSATGDATLVHEPASFFSSSDLHLSEAGNLVAAQPVDYVTTDLEGVARAAVPTIGAYEFEQLSAEQPVIADEYPKVINLSWQSADVVSRWSEGGRLYYLNTEADTEAPAADDILNARAIDAQAGQDVTVRLTGLSGQTAYKLYMILSGANGLQSDIVAAAFTTARYIAPLEVMLDEEQDDADSNESIDIIPAVTGGDEPYTYQWTNQQDVLVGEDETLTLDNPVSGVYTLTVTSADGQTASAFTALSVYGHDTNATFEDLALEPDSYWYGTQNDDIASYKFYSGAFSFSNYCNTYYQSWGGFAYANTTGTDFTSLFPGQFHNVVGGGHDSDTYAVVFTMGARCTIKVLKSREGAELDHIYVTNSSYTRDNILNGDSFSAAFADGDYHKVVFKGDDPQGSPVEFYLADYRNGRTDLVSDWQMVDLKPLGKNVKTITVTTESSNTGVPRYAVFDDLAYVGGNDPSGVENVVSDFSPADIVVIRVFNTNGSIVRQLGAPGRTVTAADLDGLAPGIYLLEYVMNNGTHEITRIVVR